MPQSLPTTQGLSHGEPAVLNTLVHFPSLLCLPWETSVGPSRSIETPWPSPPRELGVKLEGGTGMWDSMVIHQITLACDAFNTPLGVALSLLTTGSEATIHRWRGERGPQPLAKFTGQNQEGTQASELIALELTVPVTSQTWPLPLYEHALGQRPNRGWIFIPSSGPHRLGFDPVSLLPSWWLPILQDLGSWYAPPDSRICSPPWAASWAWTSVISSILTSPWPTPTLGTHPAPSSTPQE